MKCTICRADKKLIQLSNSRYVVCVPCFVELFEIADMIDEADMLEGKFGLKTMLAISLWSSECEG